MMTPFFVYIELVFELFVVVFCSDFFVELVFFYLFRVCQLISFFLWRKNPEWQAMKGNE